jgi:hypothetical protein
MNLAIRNGSLSALEYLGLSGTIPLEQTYNQWILIFTSLIAPQEINLLIGLSQ